jgi:hypothetical protein
MVALGDDLSMRATSKQVQYSIRLLVSDWLFIDATMDNHVQSADDRGVADVGLGIRRAGWEQIPGWPHDLEGFKTWPAPGQTATMTLTAAQWELVVGALRYWADVSDRTSDPETAARSRAIAATVERQL